MCDQTIMLQGYYSLKAYPEKLRRIKFYDEEQQNQQRHKHFLLYQL